MSHLAPLKRLLLLAMALFPMAAGAEQVYHFSVLNQHSPSLTAQNWNPILAYVSKKAGVELRLKMGKTSLETTDLTLRGEAQFAYTNHLFKPDRVKLGWQVIARPDTGGVRGQIVVPSGSAVMKLEDLAGQDIAFSSNEAFSGYKLPMEELTRRNIRVNEKFSGNQEGAIGQLKVGRVAAAGVNEDVMAAFGARESFHYRVLWSSEKYNDLPVMVAPVVPREVVEAVTRALIGMRGDEEGWRILQAGAQLLRLERPVGFIVADNSDYKNHMAFYLMQDRR